MPFKRTLPSLSLMMLSLGAIPAQAQITDPQVGALVEALRQAAPETGQADDGLYSEWQVRPDNIPRWSKQCLGREVSPPDFAASPVTARGILVCVMRDVLKEQYRLSGKNESLAVQRAAAWWMTGDPTRYRNAATATYSQQVLSLYQKLRNSPARPPQPPSGQRRVQNPNLDSLAAPAPARVVSRPNAVPLVNPRSVLSNLAVNNPPSTPQASEKVTDAQVSALVESLRRAAPTGENPGLYSEWQVKADNIPRWSQQCLQRELTPNQFATSPVTARGILVCVMREVLQQEWKSAQRNETQAVQRAAAWWMTGDSNGYQNPELAPYLQRVLSFYQELRPTGSKPSPGNTANNRPQPIETDIPLPRLRPHL